MSVRLVVADAEFLRMAQQVEGTAGTLAVCADQLAVLVRSLHETQAIMSSATKAALEKDADAISKLAREAERAVKGVVAAASEYVGAIGALDDIAT